MTPIDVATWVRAVVADALTACGRPCAHQLIAAGGFVVDDCSDGLLAVSVERIYRVGGAFPNEATSDETVTMIGLQLLVMVMRCVPTVDDVGNVPSTAEQDEAMAVLYADAAVVWNTLQGEVILEPDGLPDMDRANLTQIFSDPLGGCGGVETRVTLGVPIAGWCPPCED